MSRVSKMSLKEILDEVQLILRENDIALFCDDYNVMQQFIENSAKGRNKKENVNKFLIDNEEHIDKEKLILLTVLNYRENLILIDAQKEELLKNPEANFSQIANLHVQKREQTKNLETAIKLGKGMETFLSFYYYDDEEKRYKVDITDSRELIDGKRVSDSKNSRRFDEIDLSLKNGDETAELGMEYIIQSILLTDLYEIFPTEQIGNDIRTMILENEALKKGLKTREELQALKTIENCDEYANLVDNINFQDMLPDIKATLREYVKYVDIDKLLLISAYRFYEGLENGYIDSRLVLSVQEILKGILLHLKNKNMRISCQLQTKRDNTYDLVDVEYSGKDIKDCIRKFTNTTYLKNTQIEEYKERIQNRELKLLEIEPKYLGIIYTEEELEKVAILSDENLRCVLTTLEWNKEKIINAISQKGECGSSLLIELINSQKIDSNDIISLYMNGNISLEQIEELKEELDLSDAINSYELIQYYNNSIEKDSNEEEKSKFDRYIDVYKEILINNNSEELEESYDELVNTLLDNYQGEEYIKVVEDFYQRGLLTLDVLIEWNEEKIIDRFYNDKVITLEEIESLAQRNKISFEYINNIYTNLANKDEIDYDERLKYIKTGYISEEEIFKMYANNLIFEKDLRDLAEQGIITKKQLQKVIDSRTREDLEKNSSIVLKGLDMLTKIKSDIYLDTISKPKGYLVSVNKKNKSIIDPNIRLEFIKLFKAYRALTDLNIDSPFYNYEFYVVPDENGEIGLNSVVIAERYYEDKKTEEKFALENATYIFKYKDLMVLSKLKKSEMIKERKNIVFTASHTVATEQRNGNWASNVIYGIVKSMLSSELKEYSKENQRKIVLQKLNEVYSNEEILEILDLASQIDRGEYTYEIVNPDSNILRTTVKHEDITDDDIGLR